MKTYTLGAIILLSISSVLSAAEEVKTDNPYTVGAAKVLAGDYGYTGGDGSSYEKAIIVPLVKTSKDGIFMEKFYAKKAFPGAELKSQTLSEHNNKFYDILNYTLPDGSSIEIYFDISNFFGK